MTVSATPRRAGPYIGDGTVNTFPFAFKVFATSDLRVTVAQLAGAPATLTLGADYTVLLNADQDNQPGGDVRTHEALADGAQLTITSAVPYHQPLDIQNQGGFYPQAIEDALDRSVILTQQLADALANATASAAPAFASVVTVSTQPPSGGEDGDVWFQVN